MEKLLRDLWVKMGRAIKDFELITAGDNIAIGLSGGKDSLLLTYALARFRKVAPVPFALSAIIIDGGFAGTEGLDLSDLYGFCSSLGIDLRTHRVPIWDAVRDKGVDGNPCSLCSRLRRGALHRIAKESGCNKLALAHHADDAIETLFMNILFTSKVSCFDPKTHLTRAGLTLIRPMVYVEERLIKELAVELELPVLKNPCPANGYTKRQEVKDMLSRFEEANPGIKDRALASLTNPGKGWNW